MPPGQDIVHILSSCICAMLPGLDIAVLALEVTWGWPICHGRRTWADLSTFERHLYVCCSLPESSCCMQRCREAWSSRSSSDNGVTNFYPGPFGTCPVCAHVPECVPCDVGRILKRVRLTHRIHRAFLHVTGFARPLRITGKSIQLSRRDTDLQYIVRLDRS